MADDNAPDDVPDEDAGAIAPHSFRAGGDDGSCAECGRFADDSLHSASSIAAHNAATEEG